jgi:Uma2 family endonuclease
MSTQPKTPPLSEEEYLAIERKAPFKSEYYRGEMFAMAGASRAHNRLVANLVTEINAQLRNRPCELYPSDLRVHVPAITWYTYPDVTATCGEPQFDDATIDTLLNPTFIAEVLSESTESYDRGRKFELYQSIPSLREYLLISSDRVRVELYTIQPDGKWLLTTAGRLDDTIVLDSIGCRIAIADLYDKVELEARPLRSETAHP